MSETTETPETLPLSYGTYEEAKEWVGRKSKPVPCEDFINWAQIKNFCSLVQDGNPAYWDEDWAKQHNGGIVSPPGMLMVWPMPLPWRPNQGDRAIPLEVQIPLPGNTIINMATDTEFFKHIKVGDRLTMQTEVAKISRALQTPLGKGHFITTVYTYTNEAGEVVAKNTNNLLRFES